MSLCEGAKTRVSVDSVLLEKFEVNVGVHHGSVLSLFLFAAVVVVVTELAREGVLDEMLYADYLVLMNEINDGHRHMFMKWKVFERVTPMLIIW